MTSSDSSRWDFGRFLKTLSYFGAVPFLSQFDWFQSLFDSRPNPTLRPSVVPSGDSVVNSAQATSRQTTPEFILLNTSANSEAIQRTLTEQGETVQAPQHLETLTHSEIRERKRSLLLCLDSETDVAAVQQLLTRELHRLQQLARYRPVFDFTMPSMDIRQIWGALDDVVMGGVSQSNLQIVASAALFSGVVSTQNSGGFASVRTRNFDPPLNFAGEEGLQLRVRGDGQRYKFLIRTSLTWDSLAYSYSFDTIAGEWMTVMVPFAETLPVFRARTVDNAPPLEQSQVCALQLMLSKFEYDRALNPHFTPGPFQLQIKSIDAYAPEAVLSHYLELLIVDASGDRSHADALAAVAQQQQLPCRVGTLDDLSACL